MRLSHYNVIENWAPPIEKIAQIFLCWFWILVSDTVFSLHFNFFNYRFYIERFSSFFVRLFVCLIVNIFVYLFVLIFLSVNCIASMNSLSFFAYESDCTRIKNISIFLCPNQTCQKLDNEILRAISKPKIRNLQVGLRVW